MNNEPVIDVHNLCVTRNRTLILDSISFTVRRGDFFALIGPNGAGKTTLVKAILGLIPYQTGTISLFGMPARPETRARIGYVPQIYTFDFSFPITAHEMVLTGRMGRKTGLIRRYTDEDHRAASRALSRLAAQSLAHRPICELSGGERQRVLIARALAGDPEILVLDEPTVYVDTPTEEQFYELLSSLSHTITIVMITHDIGVVSRHVNRVACLNRRLFLHESDQVTAEMIARTYGCPVDLITHGELPHRVLPRHGDEV